MYLRLIAVFVIVLFLSGTHWKAYLSGKAQVQLEWDADSAKRIAAALEQEQAARAKEQELQANADKQRKVRDAQINTLNRSLADAIDRLRSRPERPSVASVPATPASGPVGGCTGANLYRPDGEFLAREAARADRYRLAYASCAAAYEAARAVK